MAELLSNKPVFTIVMGCNGSGKSAWKRAHYDELPLRYIDQDSIAGGFGDWNNQINREHTRELVDQEIDELINNKKDFGMESTFSGRPGTAMMDRVINAGYNVRGIYIGTNSPEINVERIEYRVIENLGHRVDPARIPQRYAYSLSNLRKRFDQFEELELIDNSIDDEFRRPNPVLQCVATRGKIEEQLPRVEMAKWCATFLDRLAEVRLQHERQRAADERRRKRREARDSSD